VTIHWSADVFYSKNYKMTDHTWILPKSNPFTNIPKSDQLCLSDKNTELTWSDVSRQVKIWREDFKAAGIVKGMRITIIADSSVHCWLATYAATGMGVSPGFCSPSQTDIERDMRIKGSNSNAVIDFRDDSVKLLHDKKSTVAETELAWWQGAGTSGNFTMAPVMWGHDKNYTGSQPMVQPYSWLLESLIKKPVVSINFMDPHIALSPDHMFTMFLLGGHAHVIKEKKEYDEASWKYKPNYLHSFPLGFDLILEASKNPYNNTRTCSSVGSAWKKESRQKLADKLGVKKFHSSYGNCEFSYLTFDVTGEKPDTIGQPFPWDKMKTWIDPDTNQVCTQGIHTGGKLYKIDDFVSQDWKFLGRPDTSMYVLRNQAKIWVEDIEAIAIEFVDKVFVFGQGDTLYVSYIGDINPEDLHKKLTLRKHQQPDVYWQLDSSFTEEKLPGYAGKVVRRSIYDYIKKNPDYLISQYLL
jgi:hypothetical protein